MLDWTPPYRSTKVLHAPMTRLRVDPPIPWFMKPRGPLVFPDPRRERGHSGLLMVGADLSVDRLLLAYRSGIFPWYDGDNPILWWSPEPRALLSSESLHVSRSLARTLRRGRFRLTVDRAFSEVVRGCAERSEGTWITSEMLEAYEALHAEGHAHSFEVWDGEVLGGGLYGVHIGGLFAAESMFHRRCDFSKIAVVTAVRSLFRAGVTLFDVQFSTPHLASLGCFEVSRAEYLKRVVESTRRRVDLRQSLRVDWAN